MHLDNKDKMTFIINKGVYYYKVMTFRLNNTGAIYERLTNKIFTDQIGKKMEVYADDILVKYRDPNNIGRISRKHMKFLGSIIYG